MSFAALDNIRNILLLWVGRMGDLVVTTPFFAALRSRFPEAQLRLVTGKAGVAAARLCALDEVLVLRRFYQPWQNFRLLASLVGRPSDLLIDCNSSFSRASWILAQAARARIKIAFAKGPGGWIYTYQLKAPTEGEHMLDRYGRLAAELGATYEPKPCIHISAQDQAQADALLKNLHLPAPFCVAIHPGNFKKFENRWPEEKFLELTRQLQNRPDVSLIYLAGPGEEGQVREMLSHLDRPVPRLGPMPVAVFAGLLKRLKLLIVNVTGTAHLAVAVGTPTFTLRSRYTHAVWMPRPQDLPAGPLHVGVVSQSWESCRDISVAAACQALDRLLQELLVRSRAAGH